MNSGESSTHQDHAERLFMLADIEAGLGNISAALAEAKRAVAVGLKSGDTGLAAYSLARQAQFLAALGKHQLARNAGRRCMTLARRAEDKGCVPLAHYIMGQVEFQAGRPALARARYLDALRSTRALGVREGEAASLHQLGVVNSLLRRYGVAQRYLKQSLVLFLELGELESAARSRYQVGLISRGIGKYARAAEDFAEALNLARQADSQRFVSQCLLAVGDACLAQGHLGLAYNALDECVKLRRSLDDVDGLADALQTQAQICVAEGKAQEARRLVEESIVLCRDRGLHGILSDALSGLAFIQQLEGDREQARTTIQESIAAAEAAQDPSKIATIRLLAAKLCQTEGKHEEALVHILAAADFYDRVEPMVADTILAQLLIAEGDLSKQAATRLYRKRKAGRSPHRAKEKDKGRNPKDKASDKR